MQIPTVPDEPTAVAELITAIDGAPVVPGAPAQATVSDVAVPGGDVPREAPLEPVPDEAPAQIAMTADPLLSDPTLPGTTGAPSIDPAPATVFDPTAAAPVGPDRVDAAPADPPPVQTPPPAPAPARVREPRWIRPASPDDVSVQDGLYRGRSQVGEVGAMLRVTPSVRSKLSGAYVPDSIVDSGLVSDSVSVGVVSIKGASHHLSGTPRQDAYAIGSDDTWLVIAITDGVSEGKLSHVAATEAARVAVTESLRALAVTTPDRVSWADVGRKARDAVRNLGRRRAQQQVGPGEVAPAISDRTIAQIMSTTCDLLVAPVERRDGSLRVWRVRVSGDGSLYVLDPARGWGLLDSGKDSTSSMVDNSVGDPLPLGGDSPDVESWDLAPGQAIILCTDGFGDVIGEGARPVGRYLFEAWQQPLDTTQLLFTSSFVNTNADDDRTAAIVWATA